jgi:hypothetical protein
MSSSSFENDSKYRRYLRSPGEYTSLASSPVLDLDSQVKLLYKALKND